MGCGTSKRTFSSKYFDISIASAERLFGGRPNLAAGEYDLEDGELLQYIRFGYYLGRKLFYFHDSLSSRMESLWIPPAFLTEHRLEVIAINRPGVGGSPPWEHLNYQVYAEKFGQIFRRLYVSKCHLLAVGSGAAWAYAVAEAHPDIVAGVIVVSGVGPPRHPKVKKSMITADRRLTYQCVKSRKWFLKFLMADMRWKLHKYIGNFPPATLKLVAEQIGESELTQKDAMSSVIPHAAHCLAEALMQKLEYSHFLEMSLELDDWKINFDKIKAPVVFYHGTEDEQTSFQLAETTATVISATRRFVAIEGVTHNALFINRGKDILDDAFQVFDNEIYPRRRPVHLPALHNLSHRSQTSVSSLIEGEEEEGRSGEGGGGDKDYSMLINAKKLAKKKDTEGEPNRAVGRSPTGSPISASMYSGTDERGSEMGSSGRKKVTRRKKVAILSEDGGSRSGGGSPSHASARRKKVDRRKQRRRERNGDEEEEEARVKPATSFRPLVAGAEGEEGQENEVPNDEAGEGRKESAEIEIGRREERAVVDGNGNRVGAEAANGPGASARPSKQAPAAGATNTRQGKGAPEELSNASTPSLPKHVAGGYSGEHNVHPQERGESSNSSHGGEEESAVPPKGSLQVPNGRGTPDLEEGSLTSSLGSRRKSPLPPPISRSPLPDLTSEPLPALPDMLSRGMVVNGNSDAQKATAHHHHHRRKRGGSQKRVNPMPSPREGKDNPTPSVAISSTVNGVVESGSVAPFE
eukprot:CAMPEP_0113919238 /NCGR_PEP_ID=MMETSP0780_2-20120614/33802_1 /TAXON_ID=652834 /ORGANISM="Palpitomonas bilix" /LENGTH=749 /DNA_ID=CAMNT_0000919147 /DNA_START=286 /DNA_END=2535 /DNA_ORIENTATION=+ /assembly_acc=CAM_ASM_000599